MHDRIRCPKFVCLFVCLSNGCSSMLDHHSFFFPLSFNYLLKLLALRAPDRILQTSAVKRYTGKVFFNSNLR